LARAAIALQRARGRLQLGVTRVASSDVRDLMPGVERLCGFDNGRRWAVWREVEADRVQLSGVWIDMLLESRQCATKRPAVRKDEVRNAVRNGYCGWTVGRLLSAEDRDNQPSL